MAVRALLDGDAIGDAWDMERFGTYHELMNRLLIASIAGKDTLRHLWLKESQQAPALAAAVTGHAYDGVVHVADVMEVMARWYEEGSPQAFSPGWESLKRIYRVMPGELTLLIGTPSAGKTHFISNILVNMATQHGWRFAVYSPEQGSPARHLRLLLTQLVGKPFDKGRGGRMDWSEAQRTLEWLNRHVVFLAPTTQMPTVQYILDIAMVEAQGAEGLQGLIIDPWNRVAHQRPDGMLETDYIGQSLVRLTRFSSDQRVHTWIIAHPTKVFSTDGKFPVITPNMVSGSAHWWNMPDNILSLHREMSNPTDCTVQVYTQKIRFDESGTMGRVAHLCYLPDTGRYGEVSHVPYAMNGSDR